MHLNQLLAQLGGEGGRDGWRESQQVVATEVGTAQLGLREWAVGDGVAQLCGPAVSRPCTQVDGDSLPRYSKLGSRNRQTKPPRLRSSGTCLHELVGTSFGLTAQP